MADKNPLPDNAPDSPDLQASVEQAAAEVDSLNDLVNAVTEAAANASSSASGGADAEAEAAMLKYLSGAIDPDAAPPERTPSTGIEMLGDVELNVTIELGRTQLMVEDVLRLNTGSVVELDKLAGDPVDVYVNDRLVARGEVLVLNDNFCIRVSEIVADLEAQAEAAARGEPAVSA